MKNRLARVREIIKREISAAIERNLTFDGGLVTVNSVDITPDLKSCFIYISVLGEEHQQADAMRVLEENRSLLQGQMARRVVLKNTPKINFRLDDSIAKGSRIIEILDELEGGQALDDEELPEFDPDYDTDDDEQFNNEANRQ